ncbi:YT521-B-like domain-containing protein [Amylocarpus encephaloides]|uniref:YT521-B-like domain-containing protein n=1 Tax=Amylocarpus encephaloides TaxID=45428 RepID=A0A9P8C6V4_9HELO|nr:YT521-B-like domain-containing protein [Amylocarpus encephaloides]
MGDTPGGSLPAGELPNTSQGTKFSGQHTTSSPTDQPVGAQQQTNYAQYQQYPSQYMPQHRQDAFEMGSLGGALPDAPYQNYHLSHQRPLGHSPGYPLQNMTHLASHSISNQGIGTPPYSVPYQPQYQGMYPSDHMAMQPQMQSPTNSGHFFSNSGFTGQGQPQPQQQIPPYYVPAGQYVPPMYGANLPPHAGRSTLSGENRQPQSPTSKEYLGSSSGAGRSESMASTISSVVRGPPRKPRQTGYAIWVGNLPPQTELMSLVAHVCKETPGLESLFLISKSNCAFANFKDEATCTAAQSKIHDSRFQGVRLVSRLRKSSVGASAGIVAPTGPAALTPPSNPPVARSPSPRDQEDLSGNVASGPNDGTRVQDGVTVKDKYFVVKSLTVEDLELSVRNGIWATQSHNEEALNNGYRTTDNVYLIFSANKSGEYFGYAKMTSQINDDPAAAIEFAPKAQSVEDPELPKAIPTPATDYAPKGRIIDDSARGTIFWEVEREEFETGEEAEDEDEQNNNSEHGSDPANPKAWGKPFNVEWVSTTRLPFYRTRGLRNPWNSNREVKIARDGTELETSVGRRLVGLFHRVPSPVAPPTHGGLPMLGGDPQMWQFQ